jgi:hypothetical protein
MGDTMTGRFQTRSRGMRMSIWLVGAAFALVGGVTSTQAATVYFGVTNGTPGQQFVIALSDPTKIAKARAILSGQEIQSTHVGGTVVATPEPYNRPGAASAPWAFHLMPASIAFFHFGNPDCNRPTTYVDLHAKAGDLDKALFPPRHWCPWGSKIVVELRPSDLSDHRVKVEDHAVPWPWATNIKR